MKTGKVYVLISSWVGDAYLLDGLDELLGKRSYEARLARGSFIQGLLKLAGLTKVPVLPAVFYLDGDVILWWGSKPSREELVTGLGLEVPQAPQAERAGVDESIDADT